MTVNIPFVVIGILLLWIPRHWMRRGVALLRRRRRSAGSTRVTEPWKDREPGDPRVSIKDEFTKARNYIDLFRAAAGSIVFAGGMGIAPAMIAVANAPHSASLQVMAFRAIILLVGLLVQTMRWENNRITFYPPIFYLAGLSVGLCDIRGAMFAFGLIWAVSPLLSNSSWFLAVYAVFLVVFGHFFGGGDIWALYAGGLSFLPVVLSLLARRPLAIFTRRGSRTA